MGELSVLEQLKRRRATQITEADLVALVDVVAQHMRETTLSLVEVADAILTELEKPSNRVQLYQCSRGLKPPNIVDRSSKKIDWADLTFPELTILGWLRYFWCRMRPPQLNYRGADKIFITKSDAVEVFGWVPPEEDRKTLVAVDRQKLFEHKKGAHWRKDQRDEMFRMRHLENMSDADIAKIVGFERSQVHEVIGGPQDWMRLGSWGIKPWRPTHDLLVECKLKPS